MVQNYELQFDYEFLLRFVSIIRFSTDFRFSAILMGILQAVNLTIPKLLLYNRIVTQNIELTSSLHPLRWSDPLSPVSTTTPLNSLR